MGKTVNWLEETHSGEETPNQDFVLCLSLATPKEKRYKQRLTCCYYYHVHFRLVSLSKSNENHTVALLSRLPPLSPRQLCPRHSANRRTRNRRKVVPPGTFTGPALSSPVSEEECLDTGSDVIIADHECLLYFIVTVFLWEFLTYYIILGRLD